ncbi:MAG: hypothetical protein AABX77_01900 [Nanoarchaeota archaeon]
MPVKQINTIVEGCYPDTPRSLTYCRTELQIPENVRVLDAEDSWNRKYILYATTTDFDNINIENCQSFKDYDSKKEFNKSIKGYPLKRLESKIHLIFGAQRSLTTRDGRIYIDSHYFHKDWTWYLDAVLTILKECKEIFRGKNPERYNKNPSRIY